jgi:ribonuclease Z
MDVILLGTGSPLPSPDRAGPSTLVRAEALDLLFDCGRGVLMRAAAAWSGPLAFATVFLTHLHSDHVTDLNDLVTSRWALSPTPNPLKVVGPVGTQRFVDRTLDMLADDIGYRLAHHDDLTEGPQVQVTEVTDGVVFDQGGVRVLAEPTDHAPVRPTVGYRVECDGRSVVIAGDTVPCAGLDRLCAGADVYVQTVIRPSIIQMIPSARLQDVIDYHSSVEQAAQTATRNGVATLVLTHPVPPPTPGSEQEWIDEAAAHFGGVVHLGTDLLTIST